MSQDEGDSLGGRLGRYARVGSSVGGLAVKLAGQRYLGLTLDRDKHASELKAALGGLKGPLMKAAQLLATIPDALPPEYARELGQLQANAPAMGWAFVRRRSPPKGVERSAHPEGGRTKARPWRVFRDDEEFGADDDLKERIIQALGESANLVVVCRVDAARSNYVNEEILTFRRLHPERRILAVIVNGMPHDAERECFPPAFSVPAGVAQSGPEPIAADLQLFDRRQVARKVIAGLLGVTYGDHADREHARRLRRIVWGGGC